MYGSDLSQVVTKMRDLVIFLEGWVPFLLDIQANSWMVGRYAVVVMQLPIITYAVLHLTK